MAICSNINDNNCCFNDIWLKCTWNSPGIFVIRCDAWSNNNSHSIYLSSLSTTIDSSSLPTTIDSSSLSTTIYYISSFVNFYPFSPYHTFHFKLIWLFSNITTYPLSRRPPSSFESTIIPYELTTQLFSGAIIKM